ncbi:TRAPP subunit trs31 [Xylographa soralifera]|nr:TRAPP subunit trs31 [Xylographa soralifera]
MNTTQGTKPPLSSSASATSLKPPLPSPGLRTPSNRKTIYDRNLNRTRTAELSRASFAYLFSEMVTYAQKRVTGIQDLERRYVPSTHERTLPGTPSPPPSFSPKTQLLTPPSHRLNEQGYPLGVRLLPLLLYRAPPRTATRPTRILPLLQFITTTLWKHLFGRPADALERSSANEDEYMISDNEPLVNMYVSVPKEMNQLNCAAYVAGVIEGVCDAGAMTAAVSAHNGGTEMWPGKTVFLIRFEGGVVEREGILEGRGVTG